MTSRLLWMRWLSMLSLAGAQVVLIAPLSAQENPAAVKQKAAEERLKKDIYYLASDKLEGRGITTAGIQLAADHIANEFKKAGLKPVAGKDDYFQPFSLNTGGAKLEGSNTLVLHGPSGQELKLELGKEFQVVGMSESGKVDAPVVFAGYGLSLTEPKYDDYQSIDVAGKVVIVLRRTPHFEDPEAFFKDGSDPRQRAALTVKLSDALLRKAAAVIFVNDQTMSKDDDALMAFDYTAQASQKANLPTVHVLREVVDKMLASSPKTSLDSLEKEINRTLKPQSKAVDGWTASLDVHVRRKTTSVKNVIGVLEGAGPLADETIVIGAHYDHLGMGGMGSLAPNQKPAIHHGADDNGSGTTVLMELARRFGAAPDRQGRRLVFMAFTGEESGLLGSAHYCKNPLLPLDKTAAMVNLDMVGRLRDDKKTGKGKLSVAGMSSSPRFKELIDGLNQKYDFQIQASAILPDSDHFSFYAKKIPILFFETGLHPDYHRPSDTADKINVAGMRRIADFAESVASGLRSTPDRPSFTESERDPAQQAGGSPKLGIVPNNEDEKPDQEGLLIDSVVDNAAAAKAGLRGGDRIVAINGKPIKNRAAYLVAMRGRKKGDTLSVEFVRNGKRQSTNVKLR